MLGSVSFGDADWDEVTEEEEEELEEEHEAGSDPEDSE